MRGDAQGVAGVPVPGRCGTAPPPPQPLLPPCPRHLFAIANVAYSKVMDAKHNQCIVIRWDTAVPTHGRPPPTPGWPLISAALIAGCRMLPPAWPGPGADGCFWGWGAGMGFGWEHPCGPLLG